MCTRIFIEEGIQDQGQVKFLASHKSNVKIGEPSGKMITDSEQMTFVYLLDEEDAYGQIHFEQKVWPEMVAALEKGQDPVFMYQDKKIVLTGFIDELTMLIFNIEGNHNYGVTFASTVEEVFADILQQ